MNIDIMPIIIKKPLFSTKHFKEESKLKLGFSFLGDVALHLDFVDFILKEFEVNGLFKEKYRFVIENRSINKISTDKLHAPIDSIKILTPIDKTNEIFLYEKEKVGRLNKLYNITDETIELIGEPYKKDFIKFNVKRPIYLGANSLRIKGYVGKLNFNTPISLTPLLAIIKTIGAGKYYGIGGGAIQFQ